MARQVKAGTVDVSVRVRIIDAVDGTPETAVTPGAGLIMEYERHLSTSVVMTETALATLSTVHTDFGWLHVGNGYYRLDLPDAACAVGTPFVLIHGSSTGMVVIGELIELVTYDPYDSANMGLSTLSTLLARIVGTLATGTHQPQSGDSFTRLPTALVGGRIDASVGAMAADTLTNTALAASAVTEIQTGLSTLTAAQVNTEVDTALADVNLDHLVGTAAGIPAAPPADTFLAKIMDNGTITYQRSIHSLQAAVDNSAGLGGLLDNLVGPLVTVQADAGNTATTFKIDLTNLPTDGPKNAWLSFNGDTTTVALRWQTQKVLAFNTGTDFITLASPLTVAPASGDQARLVTR